MTPDDDDDSGIWTIVALLWILSPAALAIAIVAIVVYTRAS